MVMGGGHSRVDVDPCGVDVYGHTDHTDCRSEITGDTRSVMVTKEQTRSVEILQDDTLSIPLVSSSSN